MKKNNKECEWQNKFLKYCEHIVTKREHKSGIKNRVLLVISSDIFSMASGLGRNWAEDAAGWTVNVQLIKGMTGTTPVPQGSAARTQTAALMMRLCNLYHPFKTRLSGKEINDMVKSKFTSSLFCTAKAILPLYF